MLRRGAASLGIWVCFALAGVSCAPTVPSSAPKPDGHKTTHPDMSTVQNPDSSPISPPPDSSVTPPPDTRAIIDHFVFTGSCADDMQCPNAGDYCVQGAGGCAPLSGGTCTMSNTSACFGASPQCKDDSCFNPGNCASDADCHQGESCTTKTGSKGTTGQLCFPTSPCGETVNLMDVANGVYAPGKEVCVQGFVENVISECDGDYHIRLGTFTTPVCGLSPAPTYCPSTWTSCPFPPTGFPGKGLITELTPEYEPAIPTPSIGSTIYVQGTVRWDQAHCWWEIHPVKYWM